ncbi:LysR family transcriptional regulator [Methylobacterium sp. P1-11]|uniref:LysR family transcriptional regulator n=1 Tax=Methylobacterium sp. P1-11 TaxID=2024616 RepID=UPI0011EE0D08|nr:LysR family transcriptional regulator [Methylobacterium sp. P1-11]KAA0121910.1 LysR family transcriptional regulator [Methylobacterium sp. P1-11]
MELRHLRYFVAVAEEGSLTLAAERRLHTAQPSLSRQIRDLEAEVGVALLDRSVRGVVTTEAGRAFLEHARLALAQVEAAKDAARKAARPVKAAFVLGFLTGYEVDWLAGAISVLRDVLPEVDVTISSRTSPELAAALMEGKVDVAFMRAEANMPDLAFVPLTKDPLIVILPSDHRLATRDAIRLEDLADDPHIIVAWTAPTLRLIIDECLARSGLDITPTHEVDNLSMAMSLVSSTRGVALLPAYARNFLPWSVVSRPLATIGQPPGIDLVLGYRKEHSPEVLRLFLSRVDDLVARATNRRPG